MANVNNEFLAKRTVKATLTFSVQDATTVSSGGVMIPKGAIVTGVKIMGTAAGHANRSVASGTFQIRVGGLTVISALTEKELGAQTIPITGTLVQAGGVYIATSGEIDLIHQASANSSFTGTYDVYVDYIFVP